MDTTADLEKKLSDFDSSGHPLELSTEAMVQLVDEAMARIVGHIQTLPEQPMSYTEGGAELARAHS
jgi:cytochrome c553